MAARKQNYTVTQSHENLGYGRKAPMRERKVVYGGLVSNSVMSMQRPLGAAETQPTLVS